MPVGLDRAGLRDNAHITVRIVVKWKVDGKSTQADLEGAGIGAGALRPEDISVDHMSQSLLIKAGAEARVGCSELTHGLLKEVGAESGLCDGLKIGISERTWNLSPAHHLSKEPEGVISIGLSLIHI